MGTRSAMSTAEAPSLVSFQKATADFRRGTDTPREFLERSLEKLHIREPALRAFVALSLPRARIAADAATARWREGKPLSPIDGMPVGIKDIIETFDMPTGMGSPTHDGHRTVRDAAAVFGLREAGAAIVGKTATTEFAMTYPAETRNPHDPRRTPGGSSAGSGAAVGAGILPVAVGTQAIGSILRPASYCGAFGYKPTLGAINRGGSHDFQSHSCLGLIGASLADIWYTAHTIVQRCGGDPGHLGLLGAANLAEPVSPGKLVQLETDGWATATRRAREQLEAFTAQCGESGTMILTRQNHVGVAAMERSLGGALALGRDIIDFESRWLLRGIARQDRLGLSHIVLARLEAADALSLDDYRALLARRESLRAQFDELANDVDAFVTLAAPASAPEGLRATGDAAFAVPASLLGAPALSLPVFADEGLPLGLQLIGGRHQDEKLFGVAGWVLSR